jgi:protein-S-isoprenylcysteine O-methyltransferase Ste14
MKLESVILALLFVLIAMIMLPYVLAGLNTDLALPVWHTSVSVYLGIFLIAVGALLDLYCIFLFLTLGRGTPVPVDPPQLLVAQGVYKHSRNPMYIGYLLILLGEFVLLGQVLLLAYFILAMILCQLFVVFYEEPVLKKRFGETYKEYLGKTPRWL